MPTPNFADKTIWTGDNLDILRGMNAECVDLIYLDPPFNSNKDYAAPVGSASAGVAFKDTWSLSDLDVAWMGLIADERPAVANLLHTARLTHGKGMQSYLTMMAVRLLEMRRVLKNTGSIYLHCDPTAGAYLKLLMDAIFGARQYRNEIEWKRTTSRSDAKRWGRVHDRILFYSNGDKATWNGAYMPLAPDEVNKRYKYSDHRGLYREGPLTSKGLTGGGYDYEFRGHYGPWKFPEHRMRELEEDERIHMPKKVGGVPAMKLYLTDSKGRAADDMVLDIPPVNPNAQERAFFPTQKPLALLERIIRASSNPGDWVLDPFAGCATACVAAEILKRQWVGIDLSPMAYTLVRQRLSKEVGIGSEEQSHFTGWKVTHRNDIPRRTDIDAPGPYRQNKHVLFGQQEGLCNGCGVMFPFRNFTVDHMVPQSRGGTDHLDNLQLLCGACNSVKGDRPQEHLIARLKEMAI